MKKLAIPHNALVFIGDGHKALFLRNAGDEKFPSLKTEHVFTDDNPPTRDQGTDRPGRAFKRAGTNLRSGVGATDWHELEKERFAAHVASALEQQVRADKVQAIVIVAPPRTLAELRHAFHKDVANRIVAEVNKDLTKHPVGDIENLLLG